MHTNTTNAEQQTDTRDDNDNKPETPSMNALKEIRQRQGLSQTDLAIKAGLQPASICRYERGVKPGQRNARRLAAALECAVEALYPDFDALRRY